MLVSARLRSVLSPEPVAFIQLLPEAASPQMSNAVSAFTSGMRQLATPSTKSVDALAQTVLQKYLGRTSSLDRSLAELLARYASTVDAYEAAREQFAAALQLLRDCLSREEQVVSRISS
jgi:hypothetical protein